MSHHVLRPRVARFALALAGVGLFALPAGSSGAVIVADQREETPIVSSSPQTDVLSSVVRLHVPMQPGAAAHPEACDWISYERWRSADGPSDPTQADSVAILQPGVLEGATAFDGVARNTIEESAARGRHIEVWGVDRRSNCLEDSTGVDLSEQTGRGEDAVDYYFRNKPIDGKTFAGWGASDRVLADIGVAQTVNDQHSILVSELPSQAWRVKHVVCGGHSMGGFLTEIYAGWDFDGNRNTQDDAGYNQCAGFIAFDSVLNSGSIDQKQPPSKSLLGIVTGGLSGIVNQGSINLLRDGVIPRHVDLLGINPQSMMALETIAALAEKNPDGEATDLLRSLPHTKGLDDFFHIAGSPDLTSYLTTKSTIRDLRYTNMALLGQVMDDNGGPYGLVRTSFGYWDGAPVRRNRLPEQGQIIPGLGTLVSTGKLMSPAKQTNQKLSTWRNYDDLRTGTPEVVGTGITTDAEEVTDDIQFARAIHEGPLNLTENWFPIRLVVDQALLAGGVRRDSLSGAIWGRKTIVRPRIAVVAGGGLIAGQKAQDPQVLAPGYQHLDVLTAAAKQNNGQPEISSQAFANLIDKAVPR